MGPLAIALAGAGILGTASIKHEIEKHKKLKEQLAPAPTSQAKQIEQMGKEEAKAQALKTLKKWKAEAELKAKAEEKKGNK